MTWSRPLRLAVLGLTVGALSLRADPVGELLQRELHQHHVPGLACKIIQAGQPDKNYFLGTANLEWQTPVTAETVFEIGSVSKQFAAAAVLLLVEDGKLSLDDHITRFFTNAPASWSAITVRHLLTHTSGLANYDNLDGFELRQHLTPAQFIDKLAGRPLNFAPGANWSYCNSAFNLLGYLVENVSGQKYWDFLQTRIFTPLRMAHTTIRQPSQVIPHRAAGYVYTTNALYLNRDYDLTDLFAAGSIVSTVDDLARWDAAITGDQFLKKSSRELWWTPAQLADGTRVRTGKGEKAGSYGFAWFISTLQGHRNIGHTGITSGFSAANEFYPDDQLTVIILSNTDEGVFAGELAKKVAPRFFRPERK